MNPLKKEKIRSSNECASDLVLSKSAKDVYERQISILDLYPSILRLYAGTGIPVMCGQFTSTGTWFSLETLYKVTGNTNLIGGSLSGDSRGGYPSLREKVIDEIDLRGLHVQ